MKTREKFLWHQMYLTAVIPFFMAWIFSFRGLGPDYTSVGWVGVVWVGLLTIILIFRKVYLAGRNSK